MQFHFHDLGFNDDTSPTVPDDPVLGPGNYIAARLLADFSGIPSIAPYEEDRDEQRKSNYARFRSNLGPVRRGTRE